MRRKRYRRGSLQRVKQGCRYVWVVNYYDKNGRRRQTTLGQPARLTKAEAQVERERFMATINADAAEEMSRRDPPTLGELIVGTYLPFKRRRWNVSTARQAARNSGRIMNREEVLRGLSKLDMRERLIWKLAVFGRLRPGEIFALQRKHVQSNALKVEHPCS